jgi:hypothetical protein
MAFLAHHRDWNKRTLGDHLRKVVILTLGRDTAEISLRAVAPIRPSKGLIAPEGEFPLGEFSDGDQIFREFSGGRLVGVRVVRASE